MKSDTIGTPLPSKLPRPFKPAVARTPRQPERWRKIRSHDHKITTQIGQPKDSQKLTTHAIGVRASSISAATVVRRMSWDIAQLASSVVAICRKCPIPSTMHLVDARTHARTHTCAHKKADTQMQTRRHADTERDTTHNSATHHHVQLVRIPTIKNCSIQAAHLHQRATKQRQCNIQCHQGRCALRSLLYTGIQTTQLYAYG